MGRARSIAVAVLLAGLAACGGAPSASSPDEPAAQPTAAAAAPSPEPSAPQAAPVPSPAPSPAPVPSPEGLAADVFAFSAPTVGGGRVEGGELAGQDLALWFWAPWCPSCNAEAAGVAELARQFEGQVRVVGVAGRDQVPAMEAFVAEHGLEHVPSVADVDGAVWERFGVVGQPTWIFIDGETGAVGRRFGLLADDDLAAVLQTLATPT